MITVTDHSKKYYNKERESETYTIEFIKCGKIHLEKNSVIKQMNSANYSLFLITKGEYLYNEKHLVKGDILCFKKFQKINFSCISSGEVIQIKFATSKDFQIFMTKTQIFKAQIEVFEFFEQIYRSKYFNNISTGVNESYLILILNSLTNSIESTNNGKELFNATYSWIEDNITDYITPQTVANAMNCTVTHLNRIVRKNTGKSLGEIITQRKITEIKQLCRFGFSTNQIAEKLNFSSNELLRKFFQYHTGSSLKKYMSRYS